MKVVLQGSLFLCLKFLPKFFVGKQSGKNKLAWYDKNTLISYWAEGDLSEDGLIAAFDNMEGDRSKKAFIFSFIRDYAATNELSARKEKLKDMKHIDE